ncbi:MULTISPECIES: serine hydrolase [unclassified Crossiella]|uniref:serine hydrolase domain-containing protein n=1 Tax=unclassified Crossiella TaxID=2620835 RepID=UPI001FFE4715|nr:MULTISPECIES: serine hydrolase domain-containing protein [unclassified Crossiella]MCK2239082.1 beta-lactamase family protein [Crossiella sp. S99.2]MCK2251349.1 beta-lactamase family protein [Crossiella sp. S99.1]
MSKLAEIDGWLRERLPELLVAHEVPAASVAVLAGDAVVEAAAGVLNQNTGVGATTDSVFQIGSITKVWTATLVLQLVDDGLVELDAPVRTYLPEFRLAAETAAARITVRQLLSHTAGFEGDIMTDTGRGDDCVAKYVDQLRDVAQVFEPGELFGYNNAGYSVLGRIVEVLRGKCWEDCLREHLFQPLGLTHAAAGPYEAILHRVAVGHLRPDPARPQRVAPVWGMLRSNGPAGSMLAMTARDLIAFARMHLADGLAADGARVLSAVSARAMRAVQVELPELRVVGDSWGLGWELFHRPQGTVIGHDGGTIGQSAFLRLAPEHGVAVALLTNGGNPLGLAENIVTRLVRDLTGVELPGLPEPDPAPAPVEAARYLGKYSSSVVDRVVSQDADGRLWLTMTPKGLIAEMQGRGEQRKELLPWQRDVFLVAEPAIGGYLPHAFVGDDGQGRAKFLHTTRADRRVSA